MADRPEIDTDRPRSVPTGFWLTLAVICVIATHLAGFGQVSPPVASSKLVIDPDTAPLSLLATLPHVGQSLLNAIEAARQEGPIRSEADLDRIPGIGPKTLDDLRPYLTYSASTPLEMESRSSEATESGAIPPALAGQ